MQTQQLLKVAMFRTGDFGDKGRYDESDLDKMAASYDVAYLQAPVTKDHADTGPAEGWIDRVYRDGDTLFGDWSVHPTAYQEIKESRYRHRSIEFYRKHTMPDGSVVPYVKACSILGAATPHAKGMPNIAFAEFHEPAEKIIFNEKGNDIMSVAPTFQEIRVERLATRLMRETDLTLAEATAYAEAEFKKTPREVLSALQDQTKGKAVRYRENYTRIAKRIETMMAADPSRDYKETCLQAERFVLSA